jgi:pimeloyl-ACP methyl ester carboxylesterase
MKIIRYSLITIVILLAALAVLLYKDEIPADIVDAKYTNAASQFFTMDNGARVHYRDQGNKAGPALVLVHGSNASLHTWEPWVSILGADYRIITMDLPAHGLTGATPDKDYGSEAQLQTVDALVTLLGVDNFTLGGNSMGGGVTWQYTLAHPEKVNAMILVDASGLPQFWEQMQTEQAPESGAGKKKETPLFFQLMGKPWFRAISKYVDPYFITRQGLESAYNHSPVVTDELIDRYYELALREGSREATLSRFAGPRPTRQPVDPTEFSQPTLIMWGREDALISVDFAHKFAAALPHATLVIYDDVGHVPMEEIPEKSAADTRAFLQSLRPMEL